ncbi:MAG: sulfurtransferase TusA family protein [Sedimentisphaerales bacterium]|nr:sulfurtransferase TusA family protein [Sedimentisphaerales bacterium]
MNAYIQRVLSVPASVREQTGRFRRQVERFVRGELTPTAFRAYRVPWGVYEQRSAGHFMVRVRIGAGVVSSSQLRCLARLSRAYGNGILHVTTRQDVQIHDVAIESTPHVLEDLLEAGLSSRGGGGNTVRNITACPRAGICAAERFDVTPHAIALAEYLLQFDSSYNLPRKYKIVFSGCAADCGLASVADLGFFAHHREGAKGFAVYAGGGLGPNPAVGVKVEDFIREGDIFEVAETVKRLFDKHGDRSNKHKARLRYVLKRLGPEQFIRLYRQERTAVRQEGLEGPLPQIEATDERPTTSATTNVLDGSQATADIAPEKDAGLFTFRLGLPLGDLSADELVEVARLADNYGTGLVRTTQQQNLLIPSVPEERFDDLHAEIGRLGIRTSDQRSPEVVACAGAATCKLGLCLSRSLATAITKKLAENPNSTVGGTTIRVSGCPNSCAQHHVADIGLQGHARRVDGKLLPCYDVLTGGKTAEGKAQLATRIGTVPAKAVPDLLAELFAAGKIPSQLEPLVHEYESKAIPDDYFYDWGADQPFSLAGRGPGECGAGVMDVITVDIQQAKEAIKQAALKTQDSAKSESLYQAVLASARALLVLSGDEPKTDRAIFQAFTKHLIEPGWVDLAAQELLDCAVDWRMGNKGTLADMQDRAARLVQRVEQLFLSLDANLKFKLEPVAVTRAASEGPASTVDLRGVACPLNFVKAKLAVEKVGIGDIIEIQLDDGEPIRNVSASLADQGQEVLETKRLYDHFLLRVRRTR